MNELSLSSLNRIANQFETALGFLIESAPEKILHKPATGKWSIHENLAHLGRYQEVFLDRINAILMGDNPAFDKYSADSDPAFQKWTGYSQEELVSNFRKTRKQIFNLLMELSPDQVARKGRHPRFGEINIAWWAEFFLLHEAHHLFNIYALLCERMVSSSQLK